MDLSFIKKGTKFSSMRDKKPKRFIYGFLQKIKHRLVELIAPVKNHGSYTQVRNWSINMSFTAIVTSFVCWLLMVEHPLRIGVGIAVALELALHYTKDFRDCIVKK